jgi:hypothetical protein
VEGAYQPGQVDCQGGRLRPNNRIRCGTDIRTRLRHTGNLGTRPSCPLKKPTTTTHSTQLRLTSQPTSSLGSYSMPGNRAAVTQRYSVRLTRRHPWNESWNGCPDRLAPNAFSRPVVGWSNAATVRLADAATDAGKMSLRSKCSRRCCHSSWTVRQKLSHRRTLTSHKLLRLARQLRPFLLLPRS